MEKIFHKYLDKFLTGKSINQRIQYWRSYDDHLNKIDKEIKFCKNEIKDCEQEIIELEKEKSKVLKEKEMFNESDYIPTCKPNSNDEEWNKKAYNRIKDHELQYHKELVGRFYDDSKGRFSMNCKQPDYEFLYSIRDKFIKYIVCVDCYKKHLLKDKDIQYKLSVYDIGGAK